MSSSQSQNAPEIGRIITINDEPRWVVPIGSLKLDPKNTNKHSPVSIQVIQDSLMRFGQLKPVVITPDFFIIAGSGTFQALLASGKDEIWVTQSGLRGYDANAYNIADNKTAKFSEPDTLLIRDFFQEFIEKDQSIEGTGYSEEEVVALLNLIQQSQESLPISSQPAVTEPFNQPYSSNQTGNINSYQPNQIRNQVSDVWREMPSYNQENKMGIQRIVVNFETYEDVRRFAQLLNLPITEKTRATWFPYKEKEDLSGFQVITDEES